MSKQLNLFSENEMKDMEPLPVWVNGVPFVDEVETFNKTLENLITMNQLYQVKKSGNLFMTLSSKNSKNIEKLAKEGTLWKFWTLCATLLMFPLGTVLCYMALKIRYGQHIKKYKLLICQKLAQLKKKPYRVSAKELRSKVRPVILRRLRKDGTLSTEQETEK